MHMAREHRQNTIQYLYLHLLTTKFVAILLTLTQKSYLSYLKRTKSKTLRTAKQTEDELNKSAVWSSANYTNKRLTFLKFDYRKYSNFLLLYKSTCHLLWNWHRKRRSSHWYLQLHTRLTERYRWRCADLHSDWFHAVMTHSPFSVQFIEKILNRCKYYWYKWPHSTFRQHCKYQYWKLQQGFKIPFFSIKAITCIIC